MIFSQIIISRFFPKPRRWRALAKWSAFLPLFSLLLLVNGRAGQAESPVPAPWEITADRLTHQQKPETVTAEGDVVLVRAAGTADEMRLTADWLSFSVTDQKIKARGHVFLDTGEEKIRGFMLEE